MTHAPTWKVTQDAAAAQKASDDEDKLMLAMADANFKRIRGEQSDPLPEPVREQRFVPLDLDAERQEFAELLEIINANKDADTVVTAMGLDEFMTGIDEPPVPAPATQTEE
jgi:hypothetical protein